MLPGTAWQDVAAASAVYEEAIRRGASLTLRFSEFNV